TGPGEAICEGERTAVTADKPVAPRTSSLHVPGTGLSTTVSRTSVPTTGVGIEVSPYETPFGSQMRTPTKLPTPGCPSTSTRAQTSSTFISGSTEKVVEFTEPSPETVGSKSMWND